MLGVIDHNKPERLTDEEGYVAQSFESRCYLLVA